jgi:hypothetical protein
MIQHQFAKLEGNFKQLFAFGEGEEEWILQHERWAAKLQSLKVSKFAKFAKYVSLSF